MSGELSPAEHLKFCLLSDGVSITEAAQAHIDRANGDRPMTPADYASTSGVILALDGDVWVNAPIATYNPNFVTAPRFALDLDGGQLVVRGEGLEVGARFWLPPAYHGELNDAGEPLNSYAFTHSDRVRISPVEGCAMTCKFCDLPYEYRYRTKRVEGLVDSVKRAVSDPVQPAGHVLISGGVPRPADYGYLRDCYEAVITGVDVPVDVMMVPIPELLDPAHLAALGVGELSINIEIYNRDIARKLMRRKFDQSLEHYLGFIESAAAALPPGQVRSMLLVGIEPLEDTLAGVAAIAERGGVPVLSPFRPDPATPLRNERPPSAEALEEAYLRASDIAVEHGSWLGPSCIPCSHNTLTLSASEHGHAHRYHTEPNLI